MDLVALLAMMAILAPLLLFASATSQERARLARCKNNLRQIGLFLKDYASDHDDFLPRNEEGNWPFDLDTEIINLMEEYGLQLHILFCPSQPAEKAYVRFNFTDRFKITDYVFTFPDTGLAETNINEKIVPQPITIRREEYLPTASERELATDVIISNGADRESTEFVGIFLGAPIEYRANHVEGVRATGANIVFLDGHVEWRSFDTNMVVRTIRHFWPHFWY